MVEGGGGRPPSLSHLTLPPSPPLATVLTRHVMSDYQRAEGSVSAGGQRGKVRHCDTYWGPITAVNVRGVEGRQGETIYIYIYMNVGMYV